MCIYLRFLHLSIKNCCNLHTNMNSTLNKTSGKYLLLTKTVSSGVLLAAGDLIKQEIEKRRAPASKLLTGREQVACSLLPCLAQGLPQHIFYKFLDRSFPGRDFKSISRKIPDQLIASPICICVFFFGMGYLEGHTWDETISESKMKFLSVYMVHLV